LKVKYKKRECVSGLMETDFENDIIIKCDICDKGCCINGYGEYFEEDGQQLCPECMKEK